MEKLTMTVTYDGVRRPNWDAMRRPAEIIASEAGAMTPGAAGVLDEQAATDIRRAAMDILAALGFSITTHVGYVTVLPAAGLDEERVSHQRAMERLIADRKLQEAKYASAEAAFKSTLDSLGKLLKCDRSSSAVYDAVTRLVEARAAADPAAEVTALAQERLAHRRTVAELGDAASKRKILVDTLARTLKVSISEVSETETRVIEGVRGLLATRLSYADVMAAISDATNGRFSVAPRNIGNAAAVISELAREWREKLDDSNDSEDLDDEDSVTLDIDEEDASAYRLLSSDMALVFESLATTVAMSSVDWSSSRSLAWLFGILVGWNEASIEWLKTTHGFTDDGIERMLEHRSRVEQVL